MRLVRDGHASDGGPFAAPDRSRTLSVHRRTHPGACSWTVDCCEVERVSCALVKSRHSTGRQGASERAHLLACEVLLLLCLELLCGLLWVDAVRGDAAGVRGASA